MKRILIIGGGFAGVWSALSAKRHCRILNKENDIEILLINKDNYHGIRPRYYEHDLSQVRVPLDQILAPVGIKYKLGEVINIDLNQQQIELQTGTSKTEKIGYDKLILAAGSQLYSPNIPGLDQYSFNVDSFKAAEKLSHHLNNLPQQAVSKGQYTVVIVGGGFTGIETAADIRDRIHAIAPSTSEIRIIVIDHSAIGSTLGSEPQQTIKEAFLDLNIETISDVQVIEISHNYIKLNNDKCIDTQTVIWTAGIFANPLTINFPTYKDKFGRLAVDSYLHIENIENCFAAGDVAAAKVDETHYSLLSCQHAIPQGKVAGYNAVAELFNQPLIPYEQKKYVLCLDLGSWGALFAEGWERHIIKTKDAAKSVKTYINQTRIYPPLNNSDALLEAAAPILKPIPNN